MVSENVPPNSHSDGDCNSSIDIKERFNMLMAPIICLLARPSFDSTSVSWNVKNKSSNAFNTWAYHVFTSTKGYRDNRVNYLEGVTRRPNAW
jgi:hypothetical protein